MYRKPLTMDATLGRRKETEKATHLEAAIARVIAEGKVPTYDMSANWTDSSGGEGGKDSTLDVAKAIADYASS